MINFGINGFGRIGRNTTRIWYGKHRKNKTLKLINTSGSMGLKDWVHLLKYDTSYGRFGVEVSYKESQSLLEISDNNPVLGEIFIGKEKIIVTAQRDPAKIPWKKYGVDIVIDSTGVFNTQDKASAHLKAGAKKVILSAPSKGGDVSTSVMGVNSFNQSSDVFSNASCTTNCVAPVMQIMIDNFGVDRAMLNTIHAYTDGQNVLDNSNKKNMRLARAAAYNLIPSSTGAAIATTKILPSLEGKFSGMSVRVPTAVVSMSDIVMNIKKKATKEEINAVFESAAKSDRWKGILAVEHDPVVSSDITARPESSIVDLALTEVVDGVMVKIISWYDNEWGYCSRLIEQLDNI